MPNEELKPRYMILKRDNMYTTSAKAEVHVLKPVQVVGSIVEAADAIYINEPEEVPHDTYFIVNFTDFKSNGGIADG